MPEALIFDVDGTLAETEELHRRAFNETFAEWGLGWHWDRADYRRLLNVTGGKERIAAFMAEAGMHGTDIAALHRAKTARYSELMAQGGLELRPGVADLILQAKAAGLRLAVATTTSRVNVDALCAACFKRPAHDVFEVVAAGDEVARKKPAPDVFLLALERLDLAAGVCIAFEDSPNGLQSARAAGLATIVTPSAYTMGEDFAGALRVLPDLAALGGVCGLQRLMEE